MKRLIAVGLTGAALAFCTAPDSAAARCAEDSPCWNWRTMGNHTRGVTTLAGRHKIVGPVAFDRLDDACRIDWERSRELRGDGSRCNMQNY